ncbi:uncharacterized protein LOC134195102 [Corticium candelabrum]|uniref:uncharacterized protein LOC134195102 n=1 Tax=Corticium candelabrum TaxID=121492 RepID=UPI002E26568E|nr:uncharacterized protein LOC134195102 [Corticium candelabrum]
MRRGSMLRSSLLLTIMLVGVRPHDQLDCLVNTLFQTVSELQNDIKELMKTSNEQTKNATNTRELADELAAELREMKACNAQGKMLGSSGECIQLNPKFEIKWITFNGITMEIYGQKGVERIQRHELLNEGYQIFWSIPFANRNYTLTGSSNMLFTHGAMFGLQGNNIQGDTNNYFREDSCGVAVRKPDTNSNTDSDYISVVAIGTE